MYVSNKGQYISLDLFLIADMQLYKRLCPLVHWSVGLSRLRCYARIENAKNVYSGCCSWFCLWVSVLFVNMMRKGMKFYARNRNFKTFA